MALEKLEPSIESNAEILAGIRAEIENLPDVNIVGRNAEQGICASDKEGNLHYLRLEEGKAYVFDSQEDPVEYADVAGAIEALKAKL